ncbi:tRNA pseudouridine(55) synthase TruB [Skermania piniformis]|uniref:tRNA pseudouridine synthase B n=1 Tax=Skermania pinensis TaxID=39122 RepID=A0ABX8S480_9ACTN|nr:tRNA pseudouridine(55) synthase TruB [Skermania piniformis]QXQ12637.1 tRNA pseudouridine(55) synthase TruB [Skermania piniformis]
MSSSTPPGLLIVDKPSGMTSHDVVSRCRRLLGTRKIGHAGTLDPMATGVLVLGVERATKLLGLLALTTKAYTATIRLGQATSTDDADGELLATTPASGVDEAAITAAVAALTGAIEQVPARVSAIKVDGRRAHARARAGEEFVLAARPVTVSRFDVLTRRDVGASIDLDVVVECSSGTYVRALARDLGAALGVGGHLTALRRTRVGPFTIDQAATLDRVADEPGVSLDIDTAIRAAFPVRTVDEAETAALQHGRWLDSIGIVGVYAAVDAAGRAQALVEERGRRAAPMFVVRPHGL